jgi:hypothetical protein
MLKLKAVGTLIMIGCYSSGCSETQNTTLAEVESPGGYWIARVTREQHFGPGGAAIFGAVDIRQGAMDRHATQVLLVEQPDVSPDHIEASWLGPHRLHLSYRDAEIDFQVVKAAGVDVETSRLH